METANARAERRGCGWLAPPVFFVLFTAALFAVWLAAEPSWIAANFDADGYSPFELATLPFYAALVPLVWLRCPFGGSALRRRTLCAMVSVVAVMAIVKETDLHVAFLHWAYPSHVGADGTLLPGLFKPNGDPLTGTPFKMRVLTNAAVPFGMKAFAVMYFALFFGTFAAGFAYLFPEWLRGVFALRADAWAVGCFGASGVMVQIADRLPSWLRGASACGEKMEPSMKALCTVLEEGGEMAIAVFAILAILAGHAERRRLEAAETVSAGGCAA